MADRVYVPGYGYVTQGSAGTSGSVTSGAKRVDTGQTPSSRWITRAAQQVFANNTSQGVQDFEPDLTPALDGYVDPNMYYNTLPVGAYGPPGGVAGPMGQGAGFGTGTSMRELPALFRASTVGEAKVAYWSDPASRDLIVAAARLHYAGSPQYTDQWAEGFWNDLINASMNPGAPSPWEMLEGILSGRTAQVEDDISSGGGYGSYGSYGGGYGYGGGGGGSSSVALTDPTSARGLLLQTMQGVLGRNPTDREYRDFLKTLNKSEMANPRTVEMDGDVAVQSGGIDASVLALDFAKAADDYKATQANKFYNAFMGALGGGVSG